MKKMEGVKCGYMYRIGCKYQNFFLAAALFFVNIVGLCVNAQMHAAPVDSACETIAAQPSTPMCPMFNGSFVQTWSQLSLAIKAADVFVLFLFVIGVTIFVYWFRYRKWLPQYELPAHAGAQYYRTHREQKLYHYFVRIFARGILHTRIYA